MKNSLFEMLLTLFEQTLTKLKETHQTEETPTFPQDVNAENESEAMLLQNEEISTEFVRKAASNSTRVFTAEEKTRLTKASYQFLLRMLSWEVISTETMELIINQLLLSESRFVSLQETKWAIRNVLENDLSAEQLAFLDLVLYQKEDQCTLH